MEKTINILNFLWFIAVIEFAKIIINGEITKKRYRALYISSLPNKLNDKNANIKGRKNKKFIYKFSLELFFSYILIKLFISKRKIGNDTKIIEPSKNKILTLTEKK